MHGPTQQSWICSHMKLLEDNLFKTLGLLVFSCQILIFLFSISFRLVAQNFFSMDVLKAKILISTKFHRKGHPLLLIKRTLVKTEIPYTFNKDNVYALGVINCCPIDQSGISHPRLPRKGNQRAGV